VGQADESADGTRDISASDCRAQLARILLSSDFDAPEREHRFLRYVVDEALSGRGSRIKAYSIAVEVFGRDASFDPQSDPIVRVEAGHLRRALERYYLTAGVSDPILITIPKGGYVPTFDRKFHPLPPVDSAPVAAPPADTNPNELGPRVIVGIAALAVASIAAGLVAWWWASPGASPGAPERPRLLVQPFEDLTGTQASAAIASGLSQEVVGQLSKFRDIVVVESVDGQPGGSPSPRFALAGSVDLSDGAFRLRVRFMNRADDSVLWANSYDGGINVGEVLRAQSDIARNVATTLAQSYGVISQADASLHMDNPPEDWAAAAAEAPYYRRPCGYYPYPPCY
jgi:TolB-like protein